MNYFKDISTQVQNEVNNIVAKINSYIIEIGVIDGAQRKKVKVGINNAELMFIHENGSPLNNIPARPVLDITIKYATDNLIEKTYDKIIDGCLKKGWSDAEIELELKKLCKRIQNYARDVIYNNDGRLAPNAPSVIARKGYNHPLFQTGQLARSITCRLAKK